jgi:hypothetical protein
MVARERFIPSTPVFPKFLLSVRNWASQERFGCSRLIGCSVGYFN